MSAKHAMSVAQRLYEKGFITYMRTDSTALSTQAVQAARAQAVALYGEKAVPLNPRVYANKSKNAQEAHEAIRPSGETFRTPSEVSGELDRDEQRLYDLIWKRTMASQMSDAKSRPPPSRSRSTADGRRAEFTASGTVYTFRGFLDAYEESHDEKRGDADKADDQSLPALAVGDDLRLKDVEAKGHATSPKPRYTEASLVKALEEKGIGRPSTFASIIDVILNRGYVTKRGQALIPSWLAFSVVRLLEEHFADLVDYDFTAALEDDLDAIARGEQKREDWLKDFYFGSDEQVGPAPHRRQPRRDRRARAQLDADRRRRDPPLRQVRPVSRDRRRAEPRGRAAPGQHPGGPRARRAHARQGPGAHRRAGRRRPGARREP